MKGNSKEKPVPYEVGDRVYVWRKHDPQKLDWRHDGPHTIVEKRSDQSYRVEVGTYKSTEKKGEKKYKVVSIRHLRTFNPFDDDHDDTSPTLIEEEDNPEPQEESKNAASNPTVVPWEEQPIVKVEVGMMVLVPYWAWSEVQNENLPFTVAKILKTNTQIGDKEEVLVHRCGNDNNSYHHAQKPGFVYRKKGEEFTMHRYSAKPKDGYIPYWNNFTIGGVTHEYRILASELLQVGFTLTAGGKLPDTVLEFVRKSEWLNGNIAFSQDNP